MKKILFLFFFLSTSLFAQTQKEQDQFNRQVEEIMKAREEMLKALMDDSGSGSLEKHMMEMMKRFGNVDRDFGFERDEGAVIGEYDWITTDTHKILKIKVKQIKDHPLDIKIGKKEIKFKGDVEEVSTTGKKSVKKKISFEKSFTIPDDVDQINPEFENLDGAILVKFKKLKASAPVKKKLPSDSRVPIRAEEDDIKI